MKNLFGDMKVLHEDFIGDKETCLEGWIIQWKSPHKYFI
jgi:hypothetical protein